jgi:hypothetical protein
MDLPSLSFFPLVKNKYWHVKNCSYINLHPRKILMFVIPEDVKNGSGKYKKERYYIQILGTNLSDVCRKT